MSGRKRSPRENDQFSTLPGWGRFAVKPNNSKATFRIYQSSKWDVVVKVIKVVRWLLILIDRLILRLIILLSILLRLLPVLILVLRLRSG